VTRNEGFRKTLTAFGEYDYSRSRCAVQTLAFSLHSVRAVNP
jgi:hypothetical protein